MWIARDKNGSLWLYEYKPERWGEEWVCNKTISFDSEIEKLDSNSRFFTEVTWENSPKELIIKTEDK